jgi:chromate transporter
MASLAAFVTTWATFIPGYLFIFAGAPLIERTRGNLRLNTALTAVTAAVVGVILNLAVWFAWHVVVPVSGSCDGVPLLLGALFLVLIQKKNFGILAIVCLGVMAGLGLHLAGLR